MAEQFKKPARLKELGKAAVRFFRPSRSQRNDPIVIGDRRIESATVAEVPHQVDLDALDEADRFKSIEGVRVELHAKDRDKGTAGWAGIVPTISDKRLKLILGAGIQPEQLWDIDMIWADVVVMYKTDKDGNEMPSQVHIVQILDNPRTTRPPVRVNLPPERL